MGLAQIYETVYRNLCDEAHISPRALEKYIVSENEKIVALDATPKDSDIEPIIVMSSLATLIAVDTYKDLFKIDDNGQIEKLYKIAIKYGMKNSS